jgi:hypothetical protein
LSEPPLREEEELERERPSFIPLNQDNGAADFGEEM